MPSAHQTTLFRVKRIVAEELRIDMGRIVRHALLQNDLGADFVDMKNILEALDNEFGVVIPDDRARQLATPEDIAVAVLEITASRETTKRRRRVAFMPPNLYPIIGRRNSSDTKR